MASTPRFYNDKEAREVQILESENFLAWKDDVTIALGITGESGVIIVATSKCSGIEKIDNLMPFIAIRNPGL